MLNNKRGQMTIFLIIGIVMVLVGVVLLILLGISTKYFNSAFDVDIEAGAVNLRTVNSQSIGQFYLMVFNNADFWGICLIFGMVLGLLASAYFVRNSWPKIGAILDIGIIFLAFILSLYIRYVYAEIATALNNAGENFAITYLPKTSFFILNMPIFVAIIGVAIMILFHSGIPPKAEEINAVPQVVTG